MTASWWEADPKVNRAIWGLVQEPMVRKDGGRPDPYWESGCHPDVVERIWDKLGSALGVDCRARAKDVPVLAAPRSGRVFAKAHGTAYIIWLTPVDFDLATAAGYRTRHEWFGDRFTELADEAGPGWVWGRYRDEEQVWLTRSLAALESPTSPGGAA
ncbi:MAG: hypothetical protein QOK05_1889 [Chloroflexota bacterium]|nr:hypothetical protein [Chloroflexota bacterium]